MDPVMIDPASGLFGRHFLFTRWPVQIR